MESTEKTKVRCLVYFVGAGPGDPDLITVKGKKIIMQADLVLFAGSLVPKEVVSCAKQGAAVMDSSSMTLEETHQAILKTVRSGGVVARVHTGDPSLYGAVREQMYLLDKEGIAYEVIPGVTAAFAAAAAARVSFTIPEVTQSVIFTRVAGRTPVPEREDLKALAVHGCSMAIYLSGSKAKEISEALIEGGYGLQTMVVVGHRIGWNDEKLLVTTLQELHSAVEEEGIKAQAVFLILPGQDEKTSSRLYDASFSHGFRKERQS